MRSFCSTIALAALLVAATGCQEQNMSYDAIHGPENVLQAPIMDPAANKQQDAVNKVLYDKALADTMFLPKRVLAANTMTDSASAPTDTSVSGKNNDVHAAPNMSNNSSPAQKPAEARNN